MIPKQQLPGYLMDLMETVAPNTTIFDVLSAYLLSVLKRNLGNRTITSEELKLPLRTLRNRLWQIAAAGYEVPEPPHGTSKPWKSYDRRKKRKLTEF